MSIPLNSNSGTFSVVFVNILIQVEANNVQKLISLSRFYSVALTIQNLTIKQAKFVYYKDWQTCKVFMSGNYSTTTLLK